MSKKENKNAQFKTDEIKVFKQFKKQKIFQQISFVFGALIVAFGINSFILGGDIGNSLKTNVLEAGKHTTGSIEKKADLYLEKTQGLENNIMKIRAGKQMDNITTLSFSIIYNPGVVELQDIFSNINGLELSRIENEKGIATIILTFLNPSTIQEGKDIINFYLSKNEETTQNINIINSNFTDSTEVNYELTTSGLAF